MKLGTKSVLWGAHCFVLHPFFVAAAWIKLFGFPWDPRVWIAFFVHDLGYWGKPDMDGVEGETHVELGGRIMHALFDGWSTEKKLLLRCDEWEYQQLLEDGWVCVQKTPSLHPIYKYEFLVFNMQVRKTKWRDFTMNHSRHWAKKNGMQPSKLCFADKMAFSVVPKWMYLPMVTATGEILEYMRQVGHVYPVNLKPTTIDKLHWHAQVDRSNRNWVLEHIDGKKDTWTPSNRHHPTDPLYLLREETYSNEETNEMVGRMIRNGSPLTP